MLTAQINRKYYYDAFISHNSEDIIIAQEVANFLNLAGFTTFIDHSSLNKIGNPDYWNVIFNSLRQSKFLIVICSENEDGGGNKNGSKKDGVMQEWKHYEANNKEGSIICLLADNIKEKDINPELRKKWQCIPFSEYKQHLLNFVKRQVDNVKEIEFLECYQKVQENEEDTTAQWHLADKYFDGLGIEKNYHEAARWYEEAAIKGSSVARFRLWDRNDALFGRKDNPYFKEPWFDKTEELLLNDYNHKTDSPEVEYCLGMINYYSNTEKRIIYLQEAHNSGHHLAALRLGYIYEDRYRCGRPQCPKDLEEASYWYSEGAKRGNEEAKFKLASIYLESGDKTKNDSALQLLRESVANRYVPAMIKLADISTSNPSETVQLYSMAANSNDANAQKRLADCFIKGIGVNRNINKALLWYHKAGDNGNASAMEFLGDYYSGEFSEADIRKFYPRAFSQAVVSNATYFEAAKWYTKCLEAQPYNSVLLKKYAKTLYHLKKQLKMPEFYLNIACIVENDVPTQDKISKQELVKTAQNINNRNWLVANKQEDTVYANYIDYCLTFDGFESQIRCEFINRMKAGNVDLSYYVLRSMFINGGQNSMYRGNDGLICDDEIYIIARETILNESFSKTLDTKCIYNLLGAIYAEEYANSREKQPHNQKNFIKLWEQAAEKIPEAEYNLGVATYYGIGTPSNEVKGLWWLKQAIKHGCIPAYTRYMHIMKDIEL